jgi:uncharacterized oligopeptide transporter (OPT) family protein
MAPEYIPHISPEEKIPELTIKALVIGALLSVLMAFANVYIGLRAGMTVAACFPASVMALALLKPFKGNILEENISRTAASAGESLAAGVIFVIPAMLIYGFWPSIDWLSATIMSLLGGFLGMTFVVFLRRTFVEMKELIYPEAFATAVIVKSGQRGGIGAKYLFGALGIGAFFHLLKDGFNIFTEYLEGVFSLGTSKIRYALGLGTAEYQLVDFPRKSFMYAGTPAFSGAFMGVGYIIGFRLAALVFTGGLLSWIVLLPLLMFFHPEIGGTAIAEVPTLDFAYLVWKQQIRPIAVGTMLISAVYTMIRMGKPMAQGLKSLTKKKSETRALRTERDLPSRIALSITVGIILMLGIAYWVWTKSVGVALINTIMMMIFGFLFSAVSAYIVGQIGSSNNPISGMTLTVLLITALLMFGFGYSGTEGAIATLLVAGVVCCAAAIAGDVMQDLKIGHILGGTPAKMEIAEFVGVAAAAISIPLAIIALHKSDISLGGTGLGGKNLPAPQAGLMGMLTTGILEGEMTWILIIIGIIIGLVLILLGLKSPMIVSVGMYLPFYTTFGILIGGMVRYVTDRMIGRRNPSNELREKAISTGVLIAGGLIAGEGLMGVSLAIARFMGAEIPRLATALVWPGFLVITLIAFLLVYFPWKYVEKESQGS